MKLDLGLVVAATMAATSPSCSWAHPGANPYRGNPVKALGDFSLPAEKRRKLEAMMTAHAYTDIVVIGRDGIDGASSYGDLRNMHSGHGAVCRGPVDRSAWSSTRQERGLVYCVDGDDTCVIVPTICNNVSLVNRRRAPATDEPIDIAPAAGPPAAGGGGTPAAGPETFANALAGPEGLTGGREAEGVAPPQAMPIDSYFPSGPTLGPVLPHGPTVSPVPEPAAWSLLSAGLAALLFAGKIRMRRQHARAARRCLPTAAP